MKNTQVIQSISVTAPAKLNLSLAILSKMENGYHELLSLMQSIDLCDHLKFQFIPSETTQINLSLENEQKDFPLDDTNLIKKAANLFCKTVSNLPQTEILISISKKIPIGAGLAGGSSNAASTLLACNYSFGNPLTFDQLLDLGSQLGSDIPFCLRGGTSLARGRGEKLSPVALQDSLYFILVKPKDLFVSTAWAYNAFDQSGNKAQDISAIEKENDQLITHLKKGEIFQAAKHFQNSFESIVFKHHPLLIEIKEKLIELGCLTAHMTGSGPTMYGLVESLEKAEKILTSLQNYQPSVNSWVAQSQSSGAKINA